MVLYESTHEGRRHDLGTSGFLYRSNKLMYDQKTQSLWNTLHGRPVIGPLVGKGISLERRSVVTTTWGEWKRRHPDTRVLSLETGHARDYGEGVAYRSYFATDRLMFNVKLLDRRLPNKQPILGLVFDAEQQHPLAIDVRHLAANPIFSGVLAGRSFVILTDRSGAARVYLAPTKRFVAWDRDRTLRDAAGVTWTLHEDRLESVDGRKLERLPQHRAFWFGWYAAFPHTELIEFRPKAPEVEEGESR